MDRKQHWESVYDRKAPTEVSWYQAEAHLSFRWIRKLLPSLDAPIIDVGGGASVLVDQLRGSGYTNVTVLDLAAAALASARDRMGAAATAVHWIEADILTATLPDQHFAFWHDRAVFHFLTDARERARYVAQVRASLRRGGHVLVATFAEDGPQRCSGLEVMRYAPSALHGQFGPGFSLVAAEREMHATPSGGRQSFTYCICQWHGSPAAGN